MRQRLAIAIALGVVATLIASPVRAKRHYVEGEVIQIQLQQETRTLNQGEFNELRIRTREGQELRLRLGAGPCDRCPRVGERVRARLMRQMEPGDEFCEVRAFRNQTTRERFRLRDRSGNLVQTRSRARLGEGKGPGSQKGAARRGGGGRRGGGL
jgi:hypothetical protein